MTLRTQKAPRRLALAAAAALLLAGHASAITLNQAYEAALQNDPTFQTAVQDATAGREYRVIGRSNLLPNVQANYSLSKNNSDLITTQSGIDFPSSPQYYSRSASVSLRQPLYAPQAWALYKQGSAQSDYNVAQFDARVQEMILRVTGAYCDALFAQDQVRIATIQRDMYIEQGRVNDHLFAKGEGTKTDMLETQARLDLSEAQLLEALDNQTSTLHTLSTLVGQDVTSLDVLRPEFRLAPLPEGGYEELRRVATIRNPELVAQAFSIEAAKQEVAKSNAGHKPRLDMVLSYTKANAESLNTYNQQSTARAIGIQLNVPLYSGGQVSAISRQAVAGLEKARSQLQATTDKVLIDLRKQYLAVVSSRSRIAALDKAVESGRLLVTATEQSIKGGVRINLDLLNARQQLYTSERDLAQARYNYLVASMKMRAAAGTLGADDVRELTNYFR
ncbi:TolC family outer membrane protein [Duganella sp. CT11-25]|jgi:protease secretion system outer membrane protein|uniref:TolC family outer membrane protein n=1 Tax=unclassified Duganella TaxID=2636909 RepID=UPI0039AF92EB